MNTWSYQHFENFFFLDTLHYTLRARSVHAIASQSALFSSVSISGSVCCLPMCDIKTNWDIQIKYNYSCTQNTKMIWICSGGRRRVNEHSPRHWFASLAVKANATEKLFGNGKGAPSTNKNHSRAFQVRRTISWQVCENNYGKINSVGTVWGKKWTTKHISSLIFTPI